MELFVDALRFERLFATRQHREEQAWREAVARETMEKAIAKAEKAKPGSGADLPHDVKEWYEKVDVEKVQDRAYEATFKDWTDADWAAFQQAWLKYVERL